MSDRIVHRVARAVSGRPIFMEPGAFRVAIDGLGPRLGLDLSERQAGDGEQTFGDHKRAALQRRLAMVDGAEPVPVGEGMAEYGLTQDGLAIIPVLDTLINRYDWLAAWCGLTSYDTVGLMLDAVGKDERVRGVLLDVDSPGGEAAGMLDCADKIRKLAQVKPVWACANTLAASAGYGLACAATRVTLPRMASVGSIGVVAIHIDRSALDKEIGLKFTALYSGAHKIDGWGHAPLSDDARRRFQQQLDTARLTFATAVAGFRGMTVEQVMDTEAQVYDDAEGVSANLADAVQGFDETAAELREELGKSAAGPKIYPLYPTPRGASADVPGITSTQPAAAMESDMSEPKTTTENPTDPKPKAETTANPLATPATPPAAEATTTAQQLEAARADGLKYATEVAQLCNLAGFPGMAADFIAANKPVAAVRDELQAKRAAQPGNSEEIISGQTGASKDTSGAAAWADLVAAEKPS